MWTLMRLLALYDVDPTPLPDVTADGAKFQDALTVAFIVIGAFAVLFITVGGFRYVASQGDPQAAARAKNTIIYSIIGLVVAICAVAIVTFVLGRL